VRVFGDIVRQKFQRDEAAQLGVLALLHQPIAATAEFFNDPILAESFADHGLVSALKSYPCSHLESKPMVQTIPLRVNGPASHGCVPILPERTSEHPKKLVRGTHFVAAPRATSPDPRFARPKKNWYSTGGHESAGFRFSAD